MGTVTQQLTDGVRMLQSQAHNKSGVIELCHTSCVRTVHAAGLNRVVAIDVLFSC